MKITSRPCLRSSSPLRYSSPLTAYSARTKFSLRRSGCRTCTEAVAYLNAMGALVTWFTLQTTQDCIILLGQQFMKICTFPSFEFCGGAVSDTGSGRDARLRQSLGVSHAADACARQRAAMEKVRLPRSECDRPILANGEALRNGCPACLDHQTPISHVPTSWAASIGFPPSQQGGSLPSFQENAPRPFTMTPVIDLIC